MKSYNSKEKNISVILCLIFKFMVLGLSFVFLGQISSIKKTFSNLSKLDLTNLPKTLSSILRNYRLILIFLLISLILFIIEFVLNGKFKGSYTLEIGVNIVTIIGYVISFLLIKPVLNFFKLVTKGYNQVSEIEAFDYIKGLMGKANFLVDKINGPAQIFFKIFTIFSMIMMLISIVLMIKRLTQD